MRRLKVIQSDEAMGQVRNEIVAYLAFHVVVEKFNRCINSVLVIILITVGTAQIITAALLIQQTKFLFHSMYFCEYDFRD